MGTAMFVLKHGHSSGCLIKRHPPGWFVCQAVNFPFTAKDMNRDPSKLETLISPCQVAFTIVCLRDG